MEDQINALLEAVPATGSSGGNLDQLSPEGRQVLEDFERWLLEEDPKGIKSASTAQAYKGYIAKALAMFAADPESVDELDTDVKSAINAFRRYKAALESVESDTAAVERAGDAGT